MMKLNETWNFELDDKVWQETVVKFFPNMTVHNLKNDYNYNLNQKSLEHSIFTPSQKMIKSQLAIYLESKSKIAFRKYNIEKVINEKQLKKYHVNGDQYNKLGLTGRWEVAFALHDLIQLWQKGKIPKEINTVLTIDENIFFQQVKSLSFKLIIEHLLNIFKIKSKWNFDLIVSSKMYNATDPKNNLVRLTYALLASVIVNPTHIILRPLVGYSFDQSWKMAAHSFNVLTYETDILKMKNVFQGAIFFEKAVHEFTQSIWEALQYLFKIENLNDRINFMHTLKDARQLLLEENLKKRIIKVVGVNDFLSSLTVPKSKSLHSHVAFLEKKRKVFSKKFASIFIKANFYYVGNQIDVSVKLNELYQVFALIGINVVWQSQSAILNDSDRPQASLYVISTKEDIPDTSKQILKKNDLLVIIDKDIVSLFYQNKIDRFTYTNNPFDFFHQLEGCSK